MWAELEASGLEALAHDLLQENLADFSPSAVPKTKLYLDLVESARDSDPLLRWYHELLERGGLHSDAPNDQAWEAPIRKDTLYSSYTQWCENDGRTARNSVKSKAEWAKQLGKLLPGGLVSHRAMREGKREHFVVLPAYADCCDHLEKEIGLTVDRAPSPAQLRSVM